MTPVRLKAAGDLADVLEQENAALARLDYLAAAALLPAKQAALAALAACGEPASPLPPVAAPLARRVTVLAAENRRLLERAIAVQSRVVGIIARAAQQAANRPYGPGGRRIPLPRPGAVTLSASA